MEHPVDPNSYDANDPFGSTAGRRYPHTGSDYAVGFADVRSVADAVVYHVGFNSGNGNYICCYIPGRDWDGVKGGLYIAYLHLSSINVSEGQSVKQGERIGVSGNSGSNSAGPHLHITMSNSDIAYLGVGDKVDPYAYIQARLRKPVVVKPVAPAPAPKPTPKPLTELQKLRAQRAKLRKEITLLRKQKKLESPKGRNVVKRLARVLAKITNLKKKK
jgi:murein DD-endopeptidase MepM/ murein hydrolase activator NlpD